MMDEQVKKAIETLKTNNIRWVHSAFVDVEEYSKTWFCPQENTSTAAAFTEGIGFDGSSVRGFKSIEEST